MNANACKSILVAKKLCPNCRRVKPTEEFCRNPTTRSGRDCYCKECKNHKGRLAYLSKEQIAPLAKEKPCRKCLVVKPLYEFSKHRGSADGFQPECKRCNSDRARVENQKPGRKERRRETSAAWWASKNGKMLSRAYKLKNQFGLSNAEYEAMHAAQGGLCAICKNVETTGRRDGGGEPRRLCVDHCHDTGKNRGLLCSLCNSAIGKLQDSPKLLRVAAYYLESHKLNK